MHKKRLYGLLFVGLIVALSAIGFFSYFKGEVFNLSGRLNPSRHDLQEAARLRGDALNSRKSANGLSHSAVMAARGQESDPRSILKGALTTEDKAILSDRGVLCNSKRSLTALRSDPAVIYLRNAIIDTKADVDGTSLIPEKFRASKNTNRHILQFDKPLSKDQLEAIKAAGAVFEHYVPNCAVAVTADAETLQKLKGIAGASHVEPFHPFFKMNADIQAYLTGEVDALAAARVNAGKYRALLFSGQDSIKAVENLGAKITVARGAANNDIASIECPPSLLEAVVKSESVKWIETVQKNVPMNDLGNKTLRAVTARYSYPGLDGSGVIVGVCDTGIDFSHRAFAVDPNLPTSTNTNTRIVNYYFAASPTSDGVPGDLGGHGTHVSGSILGNGGLSASVLKMPGSGSAPYSTNKFEGTAPGARVVMIEDFNSFANAQITSLAYSNGARVCNNSWGADWAWYEIMSQEWDALVRDADANAANGNQEYISFFAAGNSGGGNTDGTGGGAGTVGMPANAKNVITIGALEQRRRATNLIPYGSDVDTDSAWQIASFSSRGPTPDGRFKPDLAAPGSFVCSVQSREVDMDSIVIPTGVERDYHNGNLDSGTNYAVMSGTSMASPLAAGCGALLYQWYTNVYNEVPSPALMKAMMISGAMPTRTYQYDQTPYAPSIVYEGWGMIDVASTINGPRTRATDYVTLYNQTDSIGNTGASVEKTIYISEQDAGGLKITLAWTDYPGTPGAGKALVNDLDLVVTGPDGFVYQGNIMERNPWGVVSTPVGYVYDSTIADHLNNVEQVIVRHAVPGQYKIEIRGYQIIQQNQDFALVVVKGASSIGDSGGSQPALALDANGYPVMVTANWHNGNPLAVQQNVIGARRWVGGFGDGQEFGTWRQLRGKWFDYGTNTDAELISGYILGAYVTEPSITVNRNNGNVYAAWVYHNFDSNMPDCVYVRYWNGTKWGQLGGSYDSGYGICDSNITVDALSPVVGIASDGNPVVAYIQGFFDLATRTLTEEPVVKKWNGNGWAPLGMSPEGKIAPGAFATALDMTVDSSGNPVVVWTDIKALKVRCYRWSGSSWSKVGEDLGSKPIGGRPRVAVSGSSVYLTWLELPEGGASLLQTARVAVNNGGSWSGLGNSMVYPGVGGTNDSAYNAQIAVAGSSVYLAVQAGDTNENAVFVKVWNGSTWGGISGSDSNNVADVGRKSTLKSMVVHPVGLPVIAVENYVSNSPIDTLVFGLVGAVEPPPFTGITTAEGSTSNTVLVTWSPVFAPGENITYEIYMYGGWSPSDPSIPSSSDPATIAAVFASAPVASPVNVGQHVLTGITANQVWYFGVRARNSGGLVDSNTRIILAGPYTLAGDQDLDWLTALEENSISNANVNIGRLPIGTSPVNKDTDGDGMWDGWEFFYSNLNTGQFYYGIGSISNIAANTNVLYLSPFDNGSSDLSRTGTYYSAKRGPYDDIDGDGLSNIEEFNWWYSNRWLLASDYNTIAGGRAAVTNWLLNPLNWDSDGDGMGDGWEVLNGFNPGDPSDAAGDADGDGVSNLVEYQLGSDPHSADSDHDGLSDFDEVNLYHTAPGSADTDGDGLDDAFELDALVGGNPLSWDSNGDGVSDGDTYQLGYTNNLAAVASLVNVILPLVTFEAGMPAGWTHSSPSLDMWHLTMADPAKPNVGTNFPVTMENTHSTNWVFRCSQYETNDLSKTYNAGGQFVWSALDTPAFSTVGARNTYVTWIEYYQTEAQWDICEVLASRDGGVNWTVVRAGVSGNSGGWIRRTADLSEFASQGAVQVRFLFRTKNIINNNYMGWFVDDVMVYSAGRIVGSVRDENGAVINNAAIYAIGIGGITNTIGAHKFVLPGKIFASTSTRADGSYTLDGLLRGNYLIKAVYSGYKSEFWNGALYTPVPQYYQAFGLGIGTNAGVTEVSQVGPQGHLDMQAANALATCDFELARGASRGSLGVLMDGAPYPVYLNQVSTNYSFWNGVTNISGPVTSAFVPYYTTNILTPSYPDWETNNMGSAVPVKPTLISDIDQGSHMVYLHPSWASMPYVSRVVVPVRDGEVTFVSIQTNAAPGTINVYSDVSGLPIYVDNRNTGSLTANSGVPQVITVLAGEHEVTLCPAVSNKWVCPKTVTVTNNSRTSVSFGVNEIWSSVGSLTVQTVDLYGNAVTGAQVYVNGSAIIAGDVTGSMTTPLTLQNLNVGSHWIAVTRDGYRQPPRQNASVYKGVANTLSIILYDADKDYDRVGDSLEIDSYTNLWTYSRSDDPDSDGLSNLVEYDQFVRYGMRLNLFNADSDSDGLSDGLELGFDGQTNMLALSTLYSQAAVHDTSVKVRFVGQFLAGTNAFNTARIATTNMWLSLEGDMFLATNVSWVAGDYGAPVLAFNVLPSGSSDRIVDYAHLRDSIIYGDTMPNAVDTDGDGMWDSFESLYIGVGGLHPLESGARDSDPDYDGLSNYKEFLGGDRVANTNDWSNPGNPDTDGDGMPDGWEIDNGLDPRDPGDATGDPDDDDLTNLEEWQAQTNPRVADTDADGLSDGLEVKYYYCNPLVADTDGDGLLDGQEVWDTECNVARHDGGFFPHWNGGDMDNDGLVDGPCDPDTDGDGIPDGFEVADPYIYGSASNPYGIRPVGSRLDPSNPNDANIDSDGDGLSNLEEYLVRDGLVGTTPSVASAGNPLYYTAMESNGIMAVEIESQQITDNWASETVVPAYSGTEYYTWRGTIFGTNVPERLDLPDATVPLLTYSVWVTNVFGANYIFELRSCHQSANDAVENEVWVSIDGGPWLIARAVGGANNTWTYTTTMFDEFGAPVANSFFLPQSSVLFGASTIQIAGRKTGLSADRFILYASTVAPAVARAAPVSPAGPTAYDAVVWDYATDPFNADSDGDGFPDGWEVMNGLHPRDPILQPDGTYFYRYDIYGLGLRGDPDGDGANNWCEYNVRFTINPAADVYAIQGSSDPWNMDTDNDGLHDGEEIKAFASNPLSQDTDGDGVRDGGADLLVPSEVSTSSDGSNTNHYDLALNDVWYLYMPPNNTFDRPYWVRYTTNHFAATNNYPSPRWGAALARFNYSVTDDNERDNSDQRGNYVGRRSSSGANLAPAGQTLLQNQSIVVFGGRDGVRHFDEIWETRNAGTFPNVWTNKGVLTGNENFDSELVAVQRTYTIDTYDPSQADRRPRPGGPPSFMFYRGISQQDYTILWGDPHNPGAETRPNWGRVLVFGGWNVNHSYGGAILQGNDSIPPPTTTASLAAFTPRYYNTDDNTNTTVTFAWQAGGFGYQNWPYSDYGIDASMVTNENVIPFGCTNNGQYFTGICFVEVLNSGMDIGPNSSISATITVHYTSSSGEFHPHIVGELGRKSMPTPGNMGNHSTLTSPSDYSLKNGPRKRYNGPKVAADAPWVYNTTNVTIGTFPTAADRWIDIDVSRQVTEMFNVSANGNRFEYGNNMGFVIAGSNTENTLSGGLYFDETDAKLTIRITNPGYTFSGHLSGFYDAVGPNSNLLPHVKSGSWIVPNWTPLPLVVHPSGRKSTAMAYDGTRYVLFGGMNRNSALDDVWTSVDGFTDWQIYMNLTTKPPARWGHGMAVVSQGVIIFGGFDANNQPLNDAWIFSTEDNVWQKFTPRDGEVPIPRGGHAMGTYNGFVCVFGGTDWKSYYNDTWVIDSVDYNSNTVKWTCITPHGSPRAPSPRAFTACSSDMCIFGGRVGLLPGGKDSDSDGLADMLEIQLGGPSAGRDPRANYLIPESAINNTNATEKMPYAFKKIGGVTAASATRQNTATFESLERRTMETTRTFPDPYELDLVAEGWSPEFTGVFDSGYDAYAAEFSDLWWHRFGGGNPYDARDVWELGQPHNDNLRANAKPSKAYGGRWCYATSLAGYYPDSANMELYSPLFGLNKPVVDSTDPANTNTFFLMFYEWLDLADTNDSVRVDVVRPSSAADIKTRVSGASRPTINLLPRRTSSSNTTGEWRQVVVPMESVMNETNLFLKFVLESDATGTAGGWCIDDVSIVQGGTISGVYLGSGNISLFAQNGTNALSVATNGTGGKFGFEILPSGNYRIVAGNGSTTNGVIVGGGTWGVAVTNMTVDDIVMGIVVNSPSKLTWNSIPGAIYEIQYATPSSLLTATPWTALTQITATSWECQYIDLFASADPSRFYRVVMISVP